MTDLPGFVLHLDTPAIDINDDGQIVGVRSVDGQTRIVVSDDGQLTDVGPYRTNHPCPIPSPVWWCSGVTRVWINDAGQVGTVVDGHAVLWEDGRLVDIDGDAEASRLLALNDRGQALVMQFMAGQQVMGLWTRGRFHQVTAAPLQPQAPRIDGRLSDRGHVVVTETVATHPPAPAPCPQSTLWHRGERQELGALVGTDVNRHGQVLGTLCEVVDGIPRSTSAGLWDAGEITPLPGLGGDATYVQDLNDRGQGVGIGTLPGSGDFHTVLWEDGEVIDIGTGTGGRPNRPIGINDRGQVLIASSSTIGAATSYVWESGRLTRLPPADDPLTSVTASRMNDRGQIVGRRNVGLGPSIPTLWEVRRSDRPAR